MGAAPDSGVAPSTPESLYLESRFDEAIAGWRQRLSTPLPLEKAVATLESLAELHMLRREWLEAAKVCKTLIDLGGPHVGSYVRSFSRILHHLGDYSQAVAACDLIARNGGAAEELAGNQVQRAASLAALGRHDEARAAVTTALALAPDSVQARLWARILNPVRPGALRIASVLADGNACRALLRETPWYWSPAWIPSAFMETLADITSRHSFLDLSFVVVDADGEPLLRCDAYGCADGIRGFGGPIRLRPAAACDDWGTAAALAIEHLLALNAAYAGNLTVAELPGTTPSAVSPVGLACLRRGGTAETILAMNIDLTRPDREVWASVRKSYRPLVTAGERRFQMRIMNRANPDWQLFEYYRQLHYQHFGLKQADLIFTARQSFADLLAAGQLELMVGFDGERPISATMIIDEQGTAQYYSARYVRDADIDVGPWALWKAIERSRERGLPRFHLGYHDFQQCEDAKMRHIAFFKAGFAQSWDYVPVWRIRAPV